MATDLKKVYKGKLLELSPNVTGADIKEAVDKGIGAKATLYKYLQGDVDNIDTAAKIIAFMQPRVNQRLEQAKKLIA